MILHQRAFWLYESPKSFLPLIFVDLWSGGLDVDLSPGSFLWLHHRCLVRWRYLRWSSVVHWIRSMSLWCTWYAICSIFIRDGVGTWFIGVYHCAQLPWCKLSTIRRHSAEQFTTIGGPCLCDRLFDAGDEIVDFGREQNLQTKQQKLASVMFEHCRHQFHDYLCRRYLRQ